MTPPTGRRGPYIPIAPLRDWCQQELARDNIEPIHPVPGNRNGSVQRLADRLGVHVRVLNRILRGMHAGCRDGRKGEYPTTTIRRFVVEDMLTHADIDFYDLYPQYAHERDIELEPDAWCDRCGEDVTPIRGQCPWCDLVLAEQLGMAA